MTRYTLPLAMAILFSCNLCAQDSSYLKEIRAYQEKYVREHEVVKGKDRDQLHFFPASESYRVTCRFERIYEAPWFKMPTSADKFKEHRVYGILHFQMKDSLFRLMVYQSKDLMNIKEYADYLFIPFTDKTSGEETYDNGRYIDIKLGDIKDDQVILDFNKAYNPYCAYVNGIFNCPIPPKENDLGIAIRAGEMNYGKGH